MIQHERAVKLSTHRKSKGWSNSPNILRSSIVARTNEAPADFRWALGMIFGA